MTRKTLDGFLCCLIGADQYALRGSDVTLVARAEEMRPAEASAGPADGRAGTLMGRGAEIPVFPLGALLGGARDVRTADRHVIVTGDPRDPYGLLVDRIVRATGGGDVLPIPWVVGGSAVRWFRGVVTLAETSCLVLAPEGLRGGNASSPRAASAPTASGRASALDAGLFLAFSSGALPAVSSFDASRYAVSAARVAAVVQTISLIAVPGCERHVAALGIWRNAAVAVLDFGAAPLAAAAAARRFLVLRTEGDALVAIAVDADTMLRRASPDDRGSGLSRLTGGVPDYVRGVFTSAGEAVALLDVESLV